MAGPRNYAYVDVVNNGVTEQVLRFDGTYTANEFNLAQNGGTDTITICFMAGTQIRTLEGEVAVETLKRGDLVLSADGRLVPVVWLGKQTISTRFADPLRTLPVRIKASALDQNIPSRDLLVSPDHAILVQGTLNSCGRAGEWDFDRARNPSCRHFRLLSRRGRGSFLDSRRKHARRRPSWTM